MALNKTTILNTVIADLAAEGFTISASSTNGKFVKAIVDAIIDAITTDAVVTTVVTGTLPDGPQSAAGIGTII